MSDAGIDANVPDTVQLLHAEDRAEVIGDFLQALLVLLVNHKECDSLQSYLYQVLHSAQACTQATS